jgi:hypothetical protein
MFIWDVLFDFAQTLLFAFIDGVRRIATFFTDYSPRFA